MAEIWRIRKSSCLRTQLPMSYRKHWFAFYHCCFTSSKIRCKRKDVLCTLLCNSPIAYCIWDSFVLLRASLILSWWWWWWSLLMLLLMIIQSIIFSVALSLCQGEPNSKRADIENVFPLWKPLLPTRTWLNVMNSYGWDPGLRSFLNTNYVDLSRWCFSGSMSAGFLPIKGKALEGRRA